MAELVEPNLGSATMEYRSPALAVRFGSAAELLDGAAPTTLRALTISVRSTESDPPTALTAHLRPILANHLVVEAPSQEQRDAAVERVRGLFRKRRPWYWPLTQLYPYLWPVALAPTAFAAFEMFAAGRTGAGWLLLACWAGWLGATVQAWRGRLAPWTLIALRDEGSVFREADMAAGLGLAAAAATLGLVVAALLG